MKTPATMSPGPVGSDVTSPETAVWHGHLSDDGGATAGPTPGATLTATRLGLALEGTRGKFHVAREAVTRIGWGQLYPWLFFAVRIHHRDPHCSRELQFRPMGASVSSVIRRLGELGYPVGR